MAKLHSTTDGGVRGGCVLCAGDRAVGAGGAGDERGMAGGTPVGVEDVGGDRLPECFLCGRQRADFFFFANVADVHADHIWGKLCGDAVIVLCVHLAGADRSAGVGADGISVFGISK